MAERLKNAPLVETILELRWNPIVGGNDARPLKQLDPKYKLLVGKLEEKLKSEYPFFEVLDTTQLPDAVVLDMQVPQYRFRAKEDGWPLVQLGPGLFTINETASYDWDNDFRERTIRAIGSFFEAYTTEHIEVRSLLLRYIDVFHPKDDEKPILPFLRDKLKTNIELDNSLFEGTNVFSDAENFDLRFSFKCKKPAGTVHLRFATGGPKNPDAIVMETMVQSQSQDVPAMPGKFAEWLDQAHEIPSLWFRKLCDGDLMRRFNRDERNGAT